MSTKKIFLVLLALACLIAGLRWLTRHQPPEWDIGTYLVIGHELTNGGRLYLDIWDSKPPGVFVTYALAERITGYGTGQVYLLSVAAAIATLAGVYVAASVQSRAAGLWAAAFWAGICFDALTGADLPNTEVFMNAAMVWAVAILLGDNSRWRAPLLAGVLLALATLYKQVALAPVAGLLAADLICSNRREALTRAVTTLLVVAAVWSAVFGYFAATGRSWIFWQTMFVYPRFYAGSLAHNLLEAFHPRNLFPRAMLHIAPLAVAALLALLPRPAGLPRRAGVILPGWAVGTFFAVAWPGHFWSHYFQLYFPILAIVGGWGVDRLVRSPALKPVFGRALGVMLAVALLVPQAGWAILQPDKFIERKYGPSFFSRALSDAREIDSLLPADQTFYIWSDEAWMYFTTRRRPPAAGLWKHHTLEGPLAGWLSRRTVEQLEQNPPRLFIDWEDLPSPPDHPITQFRERTYRPLDDGRTRWPFRVYIRRDE
jgi:hypothetical protein